MIFVNIVGDTCYLSTAPDACSSTYDKDGYGDAVVVCGSPGEVANDPLAENVFAPLGKLVHSQLLILFILALVRSQKHLTLLSFFFIIR